MSLDPGRSSYVTATFCKPRGKDSQASGLFGADSRSHHRSLIPCAMAPVIFSLSGATAVLSVEQDAKISVPHSTV